MKCAASHLPHTQKQAELVKSRRDVGNFDKEFTKMVVELTPTDKLFIMNLDQNEFQGFSYTNPEFIIQV
ncbi:Protein kinase C beta type [Collichthys lucidus]|uniref:Protein kinase C beta type n=1 Tax=Collichthys lucidus TaxID=240159 RepID=A0A4U5U2W9_COLLU|nr:Protein kinase C beta type [Collichthys lucidus]